MLKLKGCSYRHPNSQIDLGAVKKKEISCSCCSQQRGLSQPGLGQRKNFSGKVMFQLKCEGWCYLDEREQKVF